MPNKTEADSSETAQETGSVEIGKRLRPRWQRWLLWSSVRLLVLAGAGAGVGTMQMRARPPDLMRHAKRIATVDAANGYFWTSKGELRLYQHQANGTASYKWDEATQKATLVGMLKSSTGQTNADPTQDTNPHAQSIRWQDKERKIKIVEASKEQEPAKRGQSRRISDYTWKIRVIQGMSASFSDFRLSQDDKQIAYACAIPHSNWGDMLMQRLRLRYHAPFRKQSVTLLISSVDGRYTEALGTLKEDMPPPHTQYSHSGTTYSFQSLFWCPDGKHLSFMYGDGVWEVPVK